MLWTWVQSTTFDFDSFICGEPSSAGRPPGKAKKRKPNDKEAEKPAAEPAASLHPQAKPKTTPRVEEKAFASPVVEATPSEHVLKREDLEKAFLTFSGPIDDADRVALWPGLAQVNAALCDYSEAALCWVHALWERDTLPAAWLSIWFYSEVVNAGAEVTQAEIDGDLAIAIPTQADMRQLAARLLYASTRTPTPASILERLPEISRYLEAHESGLGIRACWLVWRHLTKISGDLLCLARVRDRLLGRLFKEGLRPQLDVPSFIRFAGQHDKNRLRHVRQYLLEFRMEINAWLELQGQAKLPRHQPLTSTGWYADLLFAYGFAKIGDERNRDDLMKPASLISPGRRS